MNNRVLSMMFILMATLVSPQSFASGKAPSCQSVFTSSSADTLAQTSKENTAYFPSILLKTYYKQVGSWNARPTFHILNTDALLSHLKNKGMVSAELSDFDKGIDNGLQQFILNDFSSSFIIISSKKQSDVEVYTLKDVMGRWFTVHGKKGLLKNSYKLDFSTFEFIPSEKNDLNEYSGYLRKDYVETRIDRMSAAQLAAYLTKLQVKTSTNAEKASNKEQEQFLQGLNDGNQMLAELIKTNSPLTDIHLAKINLFANKGINPYEFKANAPMAGVYRGTLGTMVFVNEKPTMVDMSLFEVAQTWKMNFGVSVQRINYFLPAKEVPAKVKELLVRINKLDKTSTPMEVFELYKEFIHTHPFADGNGRTGRMLLNYLLIKAGFPPSEKPAASIFYRPQDSLRKYIKNIEKESGRTAYKDSETQSYNFENLKTFKEIQDIPAFASAVKKQYDLETLNLEHLHGTSAYLFVATYKGRYIQFESTHTGGLSDSIHTMLVKSKELINRQEAEAIKSGKEAPKFTVYPELLTQFENYHQMYQEHYLVKQFKLKNNRTPSEAEMTGIRAEVEKNVKNLIHKSQQATSDEDIIKALMATPRIPDQVKTVEDVADRIMTITAPAYQAKVYEGMVVKTSPESKQALVDIYNAFNSTKFDDFMTTIAVKALKLCRQSLECGPTQKTQIPEKYLALVLKREADQRGILIETISRQAGREPGRIFIQRIRRGSLVIDDGAPGNHGLMPHALQNLFIYEQIGNARAKQFFSELTGWTYERMFDANADFTPIQATRDITRRHYWTGVILSGNRSDSSKIGSLEFENGKYPDFIRKNGLDLVDVLEKEKGLVNDGATIKVRYKGKGFQFEVDRDGVPAGNAQSIVDQTKSG